MLEKEERSVNLSNPTPSNHKHYLSASLSLVIAFLWTVTSFQHFDTITACVFLFSDVLSSPADPSSGSDDTPLHKATPPPSEASHPQSRTQPPNAPILQRRSLPPQRSSPLGTSGRNRLLGAQFFCTRLCSDVANSRSLWCSRDPWDRMCERVLAGMLDGGGMWGWKSCQHSNSSWRHIRTLVFILQLLSERFMFWMLFLLDDGVFADAGSLVCEWVCILFETHFILLRFPKLEGP